MEFNSSVPVPLPRPVPVAGPGAVDVSFEVVETEGGRFALPVPVPAPDMAGGAGLSDKSGCSVEAQPDKTAPAIRAMHEKRGHFDAEFMNGYACQFTARTQSILLLNSHAVGTARSGF